ncbi:hypothetical protein Tco_0865270 [Tanacetum coccineum]
MKSGFLHSGGRNYNHKKKNTNESVSVTESVVSLIDATEYADTAAQNTTGSTINVVNSKTKSPNQNGDDRVPNESSINKFPSSYGNTLSPMYFIGKRLAFPVAEWFVGNNWEKYGLEKDVPLVAYTSDGLSLMATKIGTPMMLDPYTTSMYLESWGRSTYVRILTEVNACNEFSYHLMMVGPNL